MAKREATFKIGDTTMSYDGNKLTLLRGPRTPFVLAQGDLILINSDCHPKMQVPYLPDKVNDIPRLLIEEYGGQVIRPASTLKFDPNVIY